MTRAVSAAARGSARRPRITIVLWLLLIVGCTAAGALTGTNSLSDAGSGTGESAHAYNRMIAAGLQAPAVESVIVRSGSAAATSAAASKLETGLRSLRAVSHIDDPAQTAALSADGGRVVLVQAQLRGDPANASDHVSGVQRVVKQVAFEPPTTSIGEAGDGSVDHAISQIVSHDLSHAELVSLPVTLLILVLAFGALAAAAVPLLLGLTSVAGALGALGVVSQIAPSANATASVVVLIGLAVGIDYSLFYIRREREERRSGASPDAALRATAATVGRAVVVAGLTVVTALAGMLFTGLAVFTSIALASIVVVLIAVTGSLTVLPATLALLGDRIDRGRLVPRKIRDRDARRGGRRPWEAIARVVTRHPVAALVTSVCALGALAVPVLGMRTANPGATDLPAGTPVLVARQAINRWFPGSPSSAALVVTGHDLASRQAESGLRRLGDRARAVAGGHGGVIISVARDGHTALVDVPAPAKRLAAERTLIDSLRHQIEPAAPELIGPGAHIQVTGEAAFDVDFTQQLSRVTPLVIGFVLALAFVLILMAFGSPRLAAAVIGLNLLSVGAAFGLLVAVFQHHWAQGLLGFTSNGAIVSWLPLFAFVILFGLSMDYTVLVLERVREGRRAGDDARTAVMRATAATASTVTSAALVMVAVFAIFATLHLLEFKQLGFGLAAAIALDATIVRGIALPAALTLLGERGWKVPGSPVPARTRKPRRRPARVAAPHIPIAARIKQATIRFGRELAYLTIGLVTSVMSFAVVVGGTVVSLVLAPLVIGGPVFAGFARLTRAVADLDRWNAKLVSGAPLRGRYRTTTDDGVKRWVISTLRDPQTWRDLGWSALHSVVGFTFGVAALSLVASILGIVSLPIWYWSVPHSDFIGLWQSNTLPRALAVVPIAIPTLLVTVQLVRVMAACELRLAAGLLDGRGRWNHGARAATLVIGHE